MCFFLRHCEFTRYLLRLSVSCMFNIGMSPAFSDYRSLIIYYPLGIIYYSLTVLVHITRINIFRVISPDKDVILVSFKVKIYRLIRINNRKNESITWSEWWLHCSKVKYCLMLIGPIWVSSVLLVLIDLLTVKVGDPVIIESETYVWFFFCDRNTQCSQTCL